MRIRVIPGKQLLLALGGATIAALLALLTGRTVEVVSKLTGAALLVLLTVSAADYLISRRAWCECGARMLRGLPPAFALGVKRPVTLAIEIGGIDEWRVRVYDHLEPTFRFDGLPRSLTLFAGKRVEMAYFVTPTRRGEARFSPADLRLRSRWGWCELLERLGPEEARRVYPDFAQIARYAWLACDRRLQEIGIKTYQQRGEGTDFKQMAEYRYGDPVRHIDWKATLRLGKPIVREFQDERDQCILLLVDCGRRMRADDRRNGSGGSHFDQVLDAVMLLSYVALRQGDAVGALTFGTPAGAGKSFAPRKGAHALNALMSELYGLQPTVTHSDYVGAARELLHRHGKRALVIVITNFRDEDQSELGFALRLLRSRHLVMLASLRERIVGELISQPLSSADAAVEIASAHLYEQSRRDAFNRLADRAALMIDAEPDQLGVQLVNRYHAVKRAGLI
jgi:uncharacterized protein (DUF58 family)